MTAWLPSWRGEHDEFAFALALKKICLTALFLMVSAFLLTPSLLYANGLAVSNVSLTGQSSSADTVKIQFDVTWSNSWRNNTSRDAVWVFAKYSTDSGVTWGHCTLKTAGTTTPSGFSAGSGTSLNIEVPSDKMGAFLERSSVGSGTTTTTDIELVWDYATDGLSDSTSALVRVFGIEMVYVPTASFYTGDGYYFITYTPGALYDASSGSYASVQITAETAKTLGGSSSGYLMRKTGQSPADDFSTGTTQTLPAAFPKGYSAFFAMKYELTQGQYRDFLNTLLRAQQNTRTASQTANMFTMVGTSASVTSRQGVRVPSTVPSGVITFGSDFDNDKTFDESVDGEWIAMNYTSWMDLAAYADWAALRPMTELEYEKMSRGPNAPASLEHAWGNSEVTQAQGALSNSGQSGEVAANTGTGLANLNGTGTDISGPARAGFAATSATTKLKAGASYYGIMELVGNVEEMMVSIGSGSAGRNFTGTHGNGVLTTTASYAGNATNTDWPGIDATTARGVTAASGAGTRGGGWNTAIGASAFAHFLGSRYSINTAPSSRNSNYGGRLVRTAP